MNSDFSLLHRFFWHLEEEEEVGQIGQLLFYYYFIIEAVQPTVGNQYFDSILLSNWGECKLSDLIGADKDFAAVRDRVY